MSRQKKRVALLAAALLVACGCGLSEYEERIAHEKKRVDYFEQENKLLDIPISLPRKKALDKEPTSPPPPPVSFRVPKGISATGSQLASTGSLVVYHFAGPASNSLLDVYLAVDKQRDDFRQNVLDVFKFTGSASYAKEIKEPFDGKPLEFDTFSFTDNGKPPSSYTLYFYQDQGYDLAVVFRLEPTQGNDKPAANPAIDACLKTLVIGSSK